MTDQDNEAADRAMARYANGCAAAFAEVYDAIGPTLQRHLERRLGDRARAEDLLQQTFLHMVRARGAFIPGSSVRAWAFAIARSLMIDAFRRESRRARVFAGSAVPEDAMSSLPHPEQVAASRQAARGIESGLACLTSSQREAFELVRLDGRSQREAAEILGTTEKAIKALVHRASEALRGHLGDPAWSER